MDEILEYGKTAFTNGAAKQMSEKQFKLLFRKEYSDTAYELSAMEASIMYADYFMHGNALVSESGIFFKILQGQEHYGRRLKNKTILNTAIDGKVLSGEVDGGRVIAYHPNASSAIREYLDNALEIQKDT